MARRQIKYYHVGDDVLLDVDDFEDMKKLYEKKREVDFIESEVDLNEDVFFYCSPSNYVH